MDNLFGLILNRNKCDNQPFYIIRY